MNDYEKLLTKMKKQKHQLRILINKITDYKQEIEELKAQLEMYENGVYFSSENDELQARIDKAIEYVENNVIQIKLNEVGTVTTVSEKFDKDEFLEILQGSDKE